VTSLLCWEYRWWLQTALKKQLHLFHRVIWRVHLFHMTCCHHTHTLIHICMHPCKRLINGDKSGPSSISSAIICSFSLSSFSVTALSLLQHTVHTVLYKSRWLPVSHCITYKLWLLTWKTFHTAQPPPHLFESTAQFPSQSLCSSNTNILARPTHIMLLSCWKSTRLVMWTLSNSVLSPSNSAAYLQWSHHYRY